MRKKVIIAISVTVGVIVAAGLGVLIWWLVTRGDDEPYSVVELEGDGIGAATYTAAFTKIRDVGDVFWWFYPSVASTPLTRPLVIWLDGVTGVPPSLLANLGMIGPYDTNFESRHDSWINQCNLLFIDAPLGTGYSTPLDSSRIPASEDENVEHLLIVLESFYSVHEEYKEAPVYIFGQGDGAKTAVALAIKNHEQSSNSTVNIKGVALGNAIISPALAMTKVGFYLEELGYIDGNGRSAIETLSEHMNSLINVGSLEAAFEEFVTLGEFINENAGAVAVNLGYIVEKLTRNPSENRDYFNQKSYIKRAFNVDADDLMNRVVASALGIDSSVTYDAHREAAIDAVKSSFMAPFTNQIQYILQSTDLTVSIYNGNLDAVSNTPGQLEWVDNLQWDGQAEFRNSTRQTLVVNRLVEGYFRETERLKFFWINAAGQSAPLDNPVALNRILPMIITPSTKEEEEEEEPFTVVELEGDGIGSAEYRAAFTRIRDVGDVFWWFYPTVISYRPINRPLVIWLDGVTGVPPSLLANLGMIGPYDVNFESRSESWINQCNLLFIDAPLGTGYSTPLDSSKIPNSVDENVEHLLIVLESFYSVHEEYKDTPVYIFGQGDGAKTAVKLAIKLNEQTATDHAVNIKGIALGNAIISPALAMTKLGFYLEELGYIDGRGRSAIETLSQHINTLINTGFLEAAFENFISLNDFVNNNAGAVAINLGHIVEKLTRNPTEERDYFTQKNYIRNIFEVDPFDLMNRVVAPALGINASVTYDAHRDTVLEAVSGSFMLPFTNEIEHILQSTDLTVSIYNGNLDAVSNTPGQLEWVDNLQWDGQTEFKNSARQTLVVNRLVEGYFRETERLKFFWINAAGQSAPLDNPVALNRILPMIIGPVPEAPYTVVGTSG